MRDEPTHAADLPKGVQGVASKQGGLITRPQLAALGVSRSQVASQVRARRWRLIGDVVILHRGTLTRGEELWFGVLHVGAERPGSVGLASFSALEVAGLRGWDRQRVHVLAARSSWCRPRQGLVVHESRRFDPDLDLVRWGGPPRTSVARSAIDAAAWQPSPRTAAGVLAATVQQRLCRPADLATALASAGRVRHVALLRQVVADIGGGADSLAEIEMGRLLTRAGLPAARRQALRIDATGRRRYIDLEVRLPDGVILEIEVDGAHHADPLAWWADQERQNGLVAADRLFARYPAFVIRTDPDAVVRSLVRITTPHLDLS